jgi:hypothetical protein
MLKGAGRRPGRPEVLHESVRTETRKGARGFPDALDPRRIATRKLASLSL